MLGLTMLLYATSLAKVEQPYIVLRKTFRSLVALEATTGLPYCELSCSVDNGGCGEGKHCTVVPTSLCDTTGECCSSVNVTCS